jgi:phosphoglycerol transferase MdoB-like AlkP superfamily enzyme
VATKVKALLATATEPLFIFVITMENHGPLHLEKAEAADSAACYTSAPPPGCDDLTVYLRHLKNADRMMGELRSCLELHLRPARLCWYGDHVPIMAEVYRQLGDPDGQTEYLIWSNRLAEKKAPATALSLDALAGQLLAS